MKGRVQKRNITKTTNLQLGSSNTDSTSMKMKIPSTNSVSNGFYGYGDTYLSDGNASESTTPANSNSIDDCDSPSLDTDFSEYLWMEHEEEFDKEVLKQLEEEELMEQCIEAMLEDEMERHMSNMSNDLNDMKLDEDPDKLAKSSKLNPLAAEFVPANMPPSPPSHKTPNPSL